MKLLRNLIFAWSLLLFGCDHPRWHGVNLTGVSWGKEFALLDPDGRLRTLEQFRGKVVLMFFGFVQCADVCPTSLARAAEVKRRLGSDGERLQVIFVTVDPERDTPAILREYTAAFDPTFLGLYGDAAATQRTANEFLVTYSKVDTGRSYTMDHTTTSYLIDPLGRLRLGESHIAPAQDIEEDVRRLLAQAN